MKGKKTRRGPCPRVYGCVCRITVIQAKLTHRAIFTPGQGVDLLLRDFTALSAACGERRTVGEGYTAGGSDMNSAL